MPNFARLFGGLIAAMLLLSRSGVVSSRLDGSRPEWTQTAALDAQPAVHSPAFAHGHSASRSPRRAWPRVDLPLATHASRSIGFANTSVAFPAVRPLFIAAVVARGYDATAPPVS
jgi:hypothetical protein